MADQFVGEIRPFAGKRVPRDWHLCDGSFVDIVTHRDLFDLIGTLYGPSDGVVFKLPDMRGRAMVSAGQGVGLRNYALAEMSGGEKVALSVNELPPHNHTMNAIAKAATSNAPTGAMLATPEGDALFYYDGATAGTDAVAAPRTITTRGGDAAHDNMMPSLVVNYIIALTGVKPQFQADEGEN